jgi:hypothetical protein
MMQEYFCRDLKELAYEDGRPRTSANNSMAGAPGLEPGNGGIKNRPSNLISLRISPDRGEKRTWSIKELQPDSRLSNRPTG